MRKVKVSELLIRLIIHFEGFKSHPYICCAGYLTIGYGTVLVFDRKFEEVPAKYKRMRWSEAKARKALEKHVAVKGLTLESYINAKIRQGLNQHQLEALKSLGYNIGNGRFKRSGMLRKLNRGQVSAMPKEIASWRRAGGKIQRGLVRRRCAEVHFFLTGKLATKDNPKYHWQNL